MAVHIKCSRPYNIEALKAIMERCGGRGPSPPRCPPMGGSQPGPQCQPGSTHSHNPRPSRSHVVRCMPCNPCGSPPQCPLPCMTCPPMAPVPPCPPCPFICPPCTGYPCVTCAPMPKPVPAPCEPPRPVARTQMNCGGLFYTGTTVCYPPTPPMCRPRCLPCTPIPGMKVSC